MATTKVTTPVTDFNKTNTEEGLKIPSGTSSNQPTGVEGMIRNDTNQSSKGSASTITYYNGTDWRYFENELNTSFNTVLYTGTSLTNAITGVGFSPDLVWLKQRSNAQNHALFDTVRGTNNFIMSNTTSAENTRTTDTLSSFDADGFTLTPYSSDAFINYTGRTMVAWCWKAGGLINKAADFNGSSSYIQTSLSLNAASNSISFWFNADSVGGQNNCLYFNNRGGRIDININGIGSNTPSASAESILINSTTAITGWNFVSIVFTGWASSYSAGSYGSAITANVYLNGGAAVSLNPTPYGQSDGLRIGRSGGSYYYDGLIGQVRVFTSALSASQVTELYNETAADNNVLNYPTSAGCIAAYPLGENANGVDGLYNGSSSNVTFGKPGYLTRNTEGTIESTVSTNNDLGFSITTYTGNGTANQTVGNGLDSPVELLIVKRTSTTGNWLVWNRDVTSGNGKYLYLDLSSGIGGPATTPVWDSSNTTTMPTSGLFNINNNSGVNASSSAYAAYSFISKPNYSKVGSYTGTGAAGNKIFTGFEPAFVMMKSTGTADWLMVDNKRIESNGNLSELFADTSSAESGSGYDIDFNIDGFTLNTLTSNANTNNQTYIYLAFANTI